MAETRDFTEAIRRHKKKGTKGKENQNNRSRCGQNPKCREKDQRSRLGISTGWGPSLKATERHARDGQYTTAS